MGARVVPVPAGVYTSLVLGLDTLLLAFTGAVW